MIDILCASRANISLIRAGGTDTQTARSQTHTPEHSWDFTCLNITSSRDGLHLPIYSHAIGYTHRSNHLHNASANPEALPFTPQPEYWGKGSRYEYRGEFCNCGQIFIRRTSTIWERTLYSNCIKRSFTPLLFNLLQCGQLQFS